MIETLTAEPAMTPPEEAEYAEAVRITDALLAGQNPMGMSVATINRWLHRRVQADAGNLRALLRKKSTGRPAAARELTQDAVDRLRRQVLKCGSVALAVQHFADDPLCPDPLRDKILSMPNPHAIPLSLRRACNVTPELEARYRGPVAYQHIAFKCRHNGTVIDPATGNARELMAGDIYVSDDMSRNRYFWFPLSDPEIETRAHRGDRLAQKYGVAIGRQGLFTMDAAGKWLGLTLVGCARDAYTSADVLRHMHSTLAEHGKPRIGWILEKGVWAAKTIDGQKVVVPEEERTQVVGGLKTLGFMVEHVHTSEGKALIESGFNHLQRVQSLMDGAPDIGRRRGEMEAQSRLISRVQQGVVHPAEAGIEHITEALEADKKALVWLNSRPKFGRIQHGVPDERWTQDTTRHSLARLEPKDGGTFMPIKLETSIRGGCVEKKMGGECYRFSLPELFGQLGHGYRLMLCFDDTNPAAGAEIYNLEGGSRNMHGWAVGEWIGHAEWENARPLYGYSDQVAESVERRKRFHRAFVQAYAGTGIFGHKSGMQIESRDGRGNVALVSTGDVPEAIPPHQADPGDGNGRRHAPPVPVRGSTDHRATPAGRTGAPASLPVEPPNPTRGARRILGRMDLVNA